MNIRPHPFAPDRRHRNHRGLYLDCLHCPLPEGNTAVHTTRAVDAGRERDAAVLGERDDQEEER